MKIYTKTGDGGTTSLMNGVRVSKSDDRIELLGTIDELSSHMGLAKVVAEDAVKETLSKIQGELIGLMAGIADPRDQKYKVKEEQIAFLEKEIDRIEGSFEREMKFVLYGGCEASARLDVARAVARRAERCFRKVSLRYGADANALQYVNRLSDFLYISARYADYLWEQKGQDGNECDCDSTGSKGLSSCQVESIVREVLKNMR